jgi:hypothetical protein
MNNIPKGDATMSGTGWAITMSILYLVLIFTLALSASARDTGFWA